MSQATGRKRRPEFNDAKPESSLATRPEGLLHESLAVEETGASQWWWIPGDVHLAYERKKERTRFGGVLIRAISIEFLSCRTFPASRGGRLGRASAGLTWARTTPSHHQL